VVATVKTVKSPIPKVCLETDDLRHVLPSVNAADRPADDPRTILEAMVRNFEPDVAENRTLIRGLLDNDREAFYANAIDLLRHSDDSPGFQHLLGLLNSDGLLPRALCDSNLSKEEAIALGRAATRADPMAEVALARGLADSGLPNSGPVQLESAPRLMEILAEISDGSRILPSMMRLMRHSNPYIRSKAVLMIGRGSHSIQWLKGRMAQADPRIRANAVEAIWSLNSREAKTLLGSALADTNNRVVGNALLGLYHMGECSVIPEIAKMAGHEASLFRSTAAWVMGETGDPRFTETLVRMLVEPDTTVRKLAVTALRRVKAVAAQTVQGAEWRMAGVIQTGQPNGRQTTLRKVHLAVASNDVDEQPKILPTQFTLTEGARNVLAYKVTERPAAEAMSVIFIFPRSEEAASAPWNQGASQCLAWKRRSDLWCNLPFLPPGDPEAAGASPRQPLPFSSSPEALEESFGRTPGRVDCSELWQTLWRCVGSDQAAARGKRHLIVVATDHIGKIAGHSLISNMIGSRTSLQVISSVSNPEVEDFCRQVKGRSRTFENEAEIPELILQAYWNLLIRYEISYQPVSPEATFLKVRVQTASGWGEVQIPILQGDLLTEPRA
jgi:hypothetical protein